jgi:hypothetical protein
MKNVADSHHAISEDTARVAEELSQAQANKISNRSDLTSGVNC